MKCAINVNSFGVYFFCARLRPLVISVFRMVVLFFGNNIDDHVQI